MGIEEVKRELKEQGERLLHLALDEEPEHGGDIDNLLDIIHFVANRISDLADQLPEEGENKEVAMDREAEHNEYRRYLERARRAWGKRFDDSALDRRFAAYLNQPEIRLHVDFGDGIRKWGYVGVTTGWRPSFILMLTSRSRGSSWLLGKDATILEVRKKAH